MEEIWPILGGEELGRGGLAVQRKGKRERG
ncbi:unnamed protein product [Tetraodon nigroviridis]|uniref:(spotted green pufferfish) hypothetical protein n=1 Tax=Tetraodon nigroviridis TaxID=99883 RepID=Q4RSU8_TETNG|nr:unnamed protein product [Tetraodon nigroviridis]